MRRLSQYLPWFALFASIGYASLACEKVLGLDDLQGRSTALTNSSTSSTSSTSSSSSSSSGTNVLGSSTSSSSSSSGDAGGAVSCAQGCDGAQCANNVCQPLIIASSLDQPSLIAAGGDTVVYTRDSSDALWYVPSNGSDKPIAIVPGLSNITKLAVVGTAVFYSTATTVMMTDNKGTSPQPVVNTSDLLSWTSDGTSLFWLVSSAAANASGTGQVFRANLDGSNATAIVTGIACCVITTGSIAAGPTRVAWDWRTDFATNGLGQQSATRAMSSALKDGTSRVDLFAQYNDVASDQFGNLFADGVYLYYYRPGGQDDMDRQAISTTGGGAVVTTFATSIVFSENYAFWLTSYESAPTTVHRRAKDLLTPADTLVSNRVAIKSIAATSNYVYVVDAGDGSITRYPTL